MPEDCAEYFSTILPVCCQPAQLFSSQVWARDAARLSTAQGRHRSIQVRYPQHVSMPTRASAERMVVLARLCT